ncbi:hypothetical protein ACFPRL_22820 [Pseudoclavibacter helvolus]
MAILAMHEDFVDAPDPVWCEVVGEIDSGAHGRGVRGDLDCVPVGRSAELCGEDGPRACCQVLDLRRACRFGSEKYGRERCNSVTEVGIESNEFGTCGLRSSQHVGRQGCASFGDKRRDCGSVRRESPPAFAGGARAVAGLDWSVPGEVLVSEFWPGAFSVTRSSHWVS